MRIRFLLPAALLISASASAALHTGETEGDVNASAGGVKTGAKSRAELRDDSGLLVRAGSHAAADVAGKTVTVTSGSVLVQAPEGDATTVHTASGDLKLDAATAIVTVGADGATKVHVLSGEATFASSQGEDATLKAGQMTLTGPGGAGDLPVTDFDLGRLTASSRLVNGFKTPLASQPAIAIATGEQAVKVEKGRLRDTGLTIVGPGKAEGFRVAPSAVVGAVVNAVSARTLRNTQAVAIATSNPNIVVLAGANVPGGVAALNLSNGTLSSSASVVTINNAATGTLMVGGANTYTGGSLVIHAASPAFNYTGGSVSSGFSGGTLDLSLITGVTALSYTLITTGNSGAGAFSTGNWTYAGGELTFTAVGGSNTPTGEGTLSGGEPILTISGALPANRPVTVSGGVVIFNVSQPNGITINGTDTLPVLTLTTDTTNITLTNAAFSGRAVSIAALGNLTLSGGSVTAKAGDIDVGASGTSATITVTNTAFTTLEALRAIKFGAKGVTPDTVSLDGATFAANGAASISASANTLNLKNVAFPAQSAVALNSRDGVLNIGSSQVGAVNFISGVTYAGDDLTTAAGINAHVNAPNGITQNGATMAGATGNVAGPVTIGKIAAH